MASPLQPTAPPVALRAVPGAAPLGAVFGVIGTLAGAAVALLGLDRLPITVCMFKALTGLPCPTCGTTRTLGRLAHGDLAGALTMSPLATLAAFLIAAWAIADAVLWLRGSALSLQVGPRVANALRWAAGLAFLANWFYLIAHGA